MLMLSVIHLWGGIMHRRGELCVDSELSFRRLAGWEKVYRSRHSEGWALDAFVTPVLSNAA